MKFTDFLKLASKPRKRKNKALLLATAKRLRSLRHEEHYNQETYAQETACGTVCCIAGHVVLAAGLPTGRLRELETDSHEDFVPEAAYLDVPIAARNLLGLSRSNTRGLFSAVPRADWPAPYGRRFHDAAYGESKERPSQVAADLLEAIAKGKVKL